MYDGVGSMSVYIVRPDPEDADLAYYGRYEVDAARHLVTHKREFHANPSASVEAVRGFAFDGDLLILTRSLGAPSGSSGEDATERNSPVFSDLLIRGHDV